MKQKTRTTLDTSDLLIENALLVSCNLDECEIANVLIEDELVPICMVRRATAREKCGREDKSAQMYSAFGGDRLSWPR
jgi:hypothetical protein